MFLATLLILYDLVAQSRDTQTYSTRYPVKCKVCTGYQGTSEIEHASSACTVDNPLAKARGLSPGTGGHTMLYLSLIHCNECMTGNEEPR